MGAFIITKIRDEGSSEPFMARMWTGIPELVDSMLGFHDNRDAKIDEFQTLYMPALENLEAMRRAARAIHNLVSDHHAKVQAGTIVSRQPNAIAVHETIGPATAGHFALLLNAGVRAMKKVQPLMEWMGVPIGHLFQKDSKFAAGQLDLAKMHHNALMQYLNSARNDWISEFIELRNDFEHGELSLDEPRYQVDDGVVSFVEPRVRGRPLAQYSLDTANREWVFMEEIVVYGISCNLDRRTIIAEICEDARVPDIPRRFKFTLAGQLDKPWLIVPPQRLNT